MAGCLAPRPSLTTSVADRIRVVGLTAMPLVYFQRCMNGWKSRSSKRSNRKQLLAMHEFSGYENGLLDPPQHALLARRGQDHLPTGQACGQPLPGSVA